MSQELIQLFCAEFSIEAIICKRIQNLFDFVANNFTLEGTDYRQWVTCCSVHVTMIHALTNIPTEKCEINNVFQPKVSLIKLVRWAEIRSIGTWFQKMQNWLSMCKILAQNTSSNGLEHYLKTQNLTHINSALKALEMEFINCKCIYYTHFTRIVKTLIDNYTVTINTNKDNDNKNNVNIDWDKLSQLTWLYFITIKKLMKLSKGDHAIGPVQTRQKAIKDFNNNNNLANSQNSNTDSNDDDEILNSNFAKKVELFSAENKNYDIEQNLLNHGDSMQNTFNLLLCATVQMAKDWTFFGISEFESDPFKWLCEQLFFHKTQQNSFVEDESHLPTSDDSGGIDGHFDSQTADRSCHDNAADHPNLFGKSNSTLQDDLVLNAKTFYVHRFLHWLEKEIICQCQINPQSSKDDDEDRLEKNDDKINFLNTKIWLKNLKCDIISGRADNEINSINQNNNNINNNNSITNDVNEIPLTTTNSYMSKEVCNVFIHQNMEYNCSILKQLYESIMLSTPSMPYSTPHTALKVAENKNHDCCCNILYIDERMFLGASHLTSPLHTPTKSSIVTIATESAVLPVTMVTTAKSPVSVVAAMGANDTLTELADSMASDNNTMKSPDTINSANLKPISPSVLFLRPNEYQNQLKLITNSAAKKKLLFSHNDNNCNNINFGNNYNVAETMKQNSEVSESDSVSKKSDYNGHGNDQSRRPTTNFEVDKESSAPSPNINENRFANLMDIKYTETTTEKKIMKIIEHLRMPNNLLNKHPNTNGLKQEKIVNIMLKYGLIFEKLFVQKHDSQHCSENYSTKDPSVELSAENSELQYSESIWNIIRSLTAKTFEIYHSMLKKCILSCETFYCHKLKQTQNERDGAYSLTEKNKIGDLTITVINAIYFALLERILQLEKWRFSRASNNAKTADTEPKTFDYNILLAHEDFNMAVWAASWEILIFLAHNMNISLFNDSINSNEANIENDINYKNDTLYNLDSCSGLGLSTYKFFRIIELCIRAIRMNPDQLSVQEHKNICSPGKSNFYLFDVSVIKHLHKIEEGILEQTVWEYSSELWTILNTCEKLPINTTTNINNKKEKIDIINNNNNEEKLKCVGDVLDSPIPLCKEVFAPRNLEYLNSNNNDNHQIMLTPLYKSNNSDTKDIMNDLPTKGGSLALFFRKVYHLASLRIRQLCVSLCNINNQNAIDINTDINDENGPLLQWSAWSAFEWALVNNSCALFRDRHIDQIILCCIYVMAKVLNMNVTFADIIKHYHSISTQSNHQVYRKVMLSSSDTNNMDPKTVSSQSKTYGDIIKFYNLVFVDIIKPYIQTFNETRLANLDPISEKTTKGIHNNINNILSPLPLRYPINTDGNNIKAPQSRSPEKEGAFNILNNVKGQQIIPGLPIYVSPLKRNYFNSNSNVNVMSPFKRILNCENNINFNNNDKTINLMSNNTTPLTYTFDKSPRKDLDRINQYIKDQAQLHKEKENSNADQLFYVSNNRLSTNTTEQNLQALISPIMSTNIHNNNSLDIRSPSIKRFKVNLNSLLLNNRGHCNVNNDIKANFNFSQNVEKPALKLIPNDLSVEKETQIYIINENSCNNNNTSAKRGLNF